MRRKKFITLAFTNSANLGEHLSKMEAENQDPEIVCPTIYNPDIKMYITTISYHEE